jgi:polar amino acid transport system substrate-binding protein
MTLYLRRLLLAVLVWCSVASNASAQDLTVVTVTRTPFSMVVDGAETGFSLDLWAEIAQELGLEYSVQRLESFSAMLGTVENGTADVAAANISITAARESMMDFSQPIFGAGLRIMVPYNESGNSILQAIWNWDFFLAALLAITVLASGGMLMWWFERKDGQPYFQGSAKEKAFPAFWWALNVVVNGGFEERVPTSAIGRLFGTLLVIASLFIVSIFVAHITAAMTVNALRTSISSVNDLYDKRVGTISGSTAADFLNTRDIRFASFTDLEALLEGFEQREIEAVVFDAPVLSYYVNTDGAEIGQLVGSVFLQEDYGFALPTNSPLEEPINRTLLSLRESGAYERLYRKWFGNETF